MEAEQFTEVIEELIERLRNTLIGKGLEYAPAGDKLRNFKLGAALNEQTPEQVLWGYVTKHIVSLHDMVASEGVFPEAKWDEKLGDYLVYGMLLRALVIDTGRAKIEPV